MKNILIFVLMVTSLTSFATTDYVCNVKLVKLEFKSNGNMSSLIIKDAQTNEFIYNGVVDEIVTNNGESDLMFEVESGKYLQLRFKTQSLEDASTVLFGLVRGYTGRDLLDNSLKCNKKEHQTSL